LRKIRSIWNNNATTPSTPPIKHRGQVLCVSKHVSRRLELGNEQYCSVYTEVHRQNVEVTNAPTVQNVERQNVEWDKMPNDKMSNDTNVERTKCLMRQNAEET
jgi:hypothetical protein